MATNEVTICNAALIALGAQPIASLIENTPRAIQCNALYAVARDEVLRAHPWNCLVTSRGAVPAECCAALRLELPIRQAWRLAAHAVRG